MARHGVVEPRVGRRSLKGDEHMSRPNLIIISCHDLGDYIAAYGTPVKTPNLDRIASQGVVLENHFSTGTVCSPSRGSIMTGCYPHTHGLMGLIHRGWALDTDRCPHMSALLGDAGYRTHLFGFQHEATKPATLGYQTIHPVASAHCEDVTPVFTDWLDAGADGGEPFMAAVGFFEVHRMGLSPSHFKRDAHSAVPDEQLDLPPYLPDIPEIREDLADLYGMIEFVDENVGKILDAVDRAGIADNTILVFTTDHGVSFIHAKATLYDGGTKVACLMRYPDGLPAGVRHEGLTSHVDLLPTFFDLMDVAVPDYVQGESLAPCLRGETENDRKHVFAEKNVTNFFDPSRMVRSHRHKLIRKGVRSCIFDFQIPEVEQTTWGWRQMKAVSSFYNARRTTEELYDLEADPGEMNNLAEDKACGVVLEELRAALTAHMEATDDPFRTYHSDLQMDEYGMQRWIDKT